MKREREVDSMSMAKYLILLSGGGHEFESMMMDSSNKRVFECKTCNRKFPSFQALGGHRASHKKPRLVMGSDESDNQSPTKPKTHECSICGLEFAIGQALGGHMRRHRTTASNGNMQSSLMTLSGSSNGVSTSVDTSPIAIANKANNKRVLFPDLNLTPLENDLEFLKIGRPTTPLVDCFN
ncbi:hypothetical protein RJT34_07949 [Clitoria ternatea]|uniref:C2H2-type domain-containing protein n=1 Tax=Clitoria ternatea TaxID=43366 RepID=A0AAN9PVB7_CLITE